MVTCRYQCFLSCQLSQIQCYKILNVMLCSSQLLLLVHEGLLTKRHRLHGTGCQQLQLLLTLLQYDKW